MAATLEAMSQSARCWAWLLLSGVLVGCAAAPHAVRQEQAGCEQAPASFEQVCQDERSLLAVCEQGQCAAYRCWQVAEYLMAGQVVRARWNLPPPPVPAPRGQTRREVGTAWSGPPGLSRHVQPVLVIPWNQPSPPLLPPGQVKVEPSQEVPRSKPYERHHIFPQAKGLKEWFTDKGIDIHQWTLALEVEEHRRIHRGANGGPWNEAWRRYQKAHLGATKLEIELHAGQLIYEFKLYGVVVPYRQQLLRLPSNLLEPD